MKDAKLPSDEHLLKQYLDGTQNCFELIVRRYSQELFHFLYRLVGSAASAEDIVQETFLQVHLAAPSFDMTRRFRPWVFTIAANKARDLLRSQKRRREMPLDAQMDGDPDSAPSFADLLCGSERPPFVGLEVEERSYQIKQLVDGLPYHLREILILGYYHGFAYRDMADILGVPLGTVKSRLHTAVQRFGDSYQELQRAPWSEVRDSAANQERNHGERSA